MAMTKFEKKVKSKILMWLSEEGYPTYARLLTDLDINLTHNPNVVAFLEPAKGRIVINGDLDRFLMSVIVRHELLHHFLKHEKRMLNHLALKFDIDPESLEVDELATGKLKQELYKNDTFNYAADYEISNRGYTDQDKEDVRNIKIGARVVCGLVTEDEHPEWVNLSVEEMYDRLMEEKEKQLQEQLLNLQDGSGDSDQGDDDSGDFSLDDEGPGSGQGLSSGESDSDMNPSQDSDQDDLNTDLDGKNQGNLLPKGTKVFYGKMVNGKFYDKNGNEIIPG